MKVISYIATASFLIAGCATIFSGTSDTITVSADPESAEIYLDGRLLGKGRVTFIVTRKAIGDKPVIRIEADGYKEQSFPLSTTFNQPAIINSTFIYAWTTDAVTGAIVKYSPTSYHVQLVNENNISRSNSQLFDEIVLRNQVRIKTEIAKKSGELLNSLAELGGYITTEDFLAEIEPITNDILREHEPLKFLQLMRDSKSKSA